MEKLNLVNFAFHYSYKIKTCHLEYAPHYQRKETNISGFLLTPNPHFGRFKTWVQEIK